MKRKVEPAASDEDLCTLSELDRRVLRHLGDRMMGDLPAVVESWCVALRCHPRCRRALADPVVEDMLRPALSLWLAQLLGCDRELDHTSGVLGEAFHVLGMNVADVPTLFLPAQQHLMRIMLRESERLHDALGYVSALNKLIAGQEAVAMRRFQLAALLQTEGGGARAN